MTIETTCRGKHCNKSFFLHIPTLEFTSGDPTISPAYFKPVAVSCPHCRDVSMYECGNRKPFIPLGFPIVQARNVVLECNCGGTLCAFSFAGASDWEAEVSKWSFGRSARCSNNNHVFRVRRVVEVSGPE
jgi:hypothetical protein